MPVHKSQAKDIHAVLLKLYRLSHELPIGSFQDAALEEVKTLVPFDSSMWGTANLRYGTEMHTVHLHQKSPEMLVEYDTVKDRDTIARSLTQAPRTTVTVNADHSFGGRDHREMRHFLSRHEHENMIVTAAYNADNHMAHWMSLYRADLDDHCTQAERELIATLAPHVMQALALNRLTHLDRMATADRALLPYGAAITDPNGCIHHIDAHLQSLLRAEWNGWNGAMLPYELLSACQAGSFQYVGRTCMIECKFEHDLLFLRARARCKADALTQREQTIARFIAKGLSHKEVALELNRAPATVRNQIQTIYGKLEVSNIASLIEEMRKMT
ncbi:MAG: helix-turn-helix transcriptional regulator [Hylemonella sp.]